MKQTQSNQTILNKNIFRAYDIRGLADIDLTPHNMYYIGRALGKLYIKKEYGENFIIGRDARNSGEKLSKAIIKGLRDVGINIKYLGLATSPMVYFAISYLKSDGGLCLTASHNPKDYNGIKACTKNAIPISKEDIQELYNRSLEEINKGTEQEEETSPGTYEEIDIYQDYLDYFKNLFQFTKKPRIVVDCGNGIPGQFYPKILSEMGAEVIELFCEVDGDFPNHIADPSHKKNCLALIEKVKETKADFGLAFDGDGDRIGLVDDQGEYLSCDLVFLLIALNTISRNPGSKIVCDLHCSAVVEELIEKENGIVIRDKTGHTNIKKRMREEKAIIGGENSGHIFFFENYFGYDDALLAALHLFSIFDQSNKSFSKLIAEIPKRHSTQEIKIKCDDSRKFEIVDKVKTHYQDRYKCNTLDGVKVFFDEKTWGLIRCSNTTPNISMRFESDQPEKTENAKRLVFEHLENYKELNIQ